MAIARTVALGELDDAVRAARRDWRRPDVGDVRGAGGVPLVARRLLLFLACSLGVTPLTFALAVVSARRCTSRLPAALGLPSRPYRRPCRLPYRRPCRRLCHHLCRYPCRCP